MGKIIIPLIVLLGISLFAIGSISDAFAQVTTTDLYSCDKRFKNNLIHKVNKTDGSMISNVIIDDLATSGRTVVGSSGFLLPYQGCLGMATDPTDAQMYLIGVDDTGNADRYIVKIDPVTGASEAIAQFTKSASAFFANNISFDTSGQMFVHESLTATPDLFYKVSKTTGVVTSTAECTFVTTTGFNFVALNHTNGKQIHIRGANLAHNIGEVDINQADCIIGSEILLDTQFEFMQDMTFDTVTGLIFLRADDNPPQQLVSTTRSGVTTILGTHLFNDQRGLAFALSIPASPTVYTTTLLDVFESSSTTLESGIPVCLNVDLESQDTCVTELKRDTTYRFEVEVKNTGGTDGSPTSLDFDDVVGSGRVLGSILSGDILSSGCSTNTDWTGSIVSADARITSGTTCLIANTTGIEEFWMVITLDSDANDGTGTFTISDGVVSDTSTITTFNNDFVPPTCSDLNCPEPTHHFPLNCNSCDGSFTSDFRKFFDILETGVDDNIAISPTTFVGSMNKTGGTTLNNGLRTSSGDPSGIDEFEYGIEMIFSYSVSGTAPTNDHEIIHFHKNSFGSVANGDVNFGLYESNGKFTFFNNTFSVGGYGSDCGSISTGERKHLLVQRNATSELVELYVDGALCTSFTDSEPEFTFNDDTSTIPTGNQVVETLENVQFVDCILFYDELFNSTQAESLTSTSLCPDVPVFNNPSSLYLLNGINSNTLKDSKVFNHLPPLLNHDFTGSTTNTDFDLVVSDQGLGLNGTGWSFLTGAELAIADVSIFGQFQAPTTMIGEFNYGIEMVFAFDDSPSFRRILDWHNLAGSVTNGDTEFGLYTDNQREFTFFDNTATVGYGSDCGTIVTDVPVHILVQRNATSELVELYVDGALCTSFTDSEPEFTFDSLAVGGRGERKVTFFKDDGGEGGQGYVECIAIYDGVMSSADAITTTSKFGQCFNGNDAPVTTLIGLSQVEIGLGEDYIELGATCDDTEEGSLPVTIGGDIIDNTKPAFLTVTYDCQDSHSTFALNLSSGLSTDRFGVSGTKFRSIPLEEQDAPQLTRLVVVGGGFGQGAGVGGAVGGQSPVGSPPLTQEEQQAIDIAFDLAVQEAIDAVGLSEGNIVETIIQTFFEFTVVDRVHEELTLNSFLVNERLGLRWSTGDDIIITSATPASSPFLITFEKFPVVKQGSGAFVSTDFLTYILQVPRDECTIEVTSDCVQKVRYEVPITVNAIINGTNVSDTGTITVDLTEDPLDPVLLIILATLSIPIIGVIIQRARGRAVQVPLSQVISG